MVRNSAFRQNGPPERQWHLPRAPDRRHGASLVAKALYDLRRTGGRYALVTVRIGGGQGIATVFERI